MKKVLTKKLSVKAVKLISVLIITCLIYLTLTFYSDYNENFSKLVPVLLIPIGWLIKLIFDEIKNIKSDKFEPPNKWITDPNTFVNRENVIDEVLNNLNSNKMSVITIYGARGIGKSYLLEYIADISNGYVEKYSKQYKELNKYIFTTYYFNFRGMISTDTFIDKFEEKAGTLKEFTEKNNKLTNKNIVIILDNIYNLNHITQVEEFIEHYFGYRENDKIIIGSCDKLNKLNLSKEYKSSSCLNPFNTDNIRQMVKNNLEIEYEPNDLNKLQQLTKGVPQYVSLIVCQLSEEQLNLKIETAPEGLELYMQKLIDQTLSSDDKSLLLYISLLSLEEASVNRQKLREISGKSVAANLGNLRYLHIVDEIDKNTFYINNLFSTLIVQLFVKNEVDLYDEVCSNLIEKFNDKKESKVFFLLFRRTEKTEEEKNIITNLLEHKINAKEYTYILKLYDNREIFNIQSSELYKLLHFSYASALAAIGKYDEAKDENNYAIESVDIRHLNIDIDFNIQYLMADIDHLQDDFCLAISMLEQLKLQTNEEKFKKFKCKCLWLLGHVHLHKCDYTESLYFFDKCTESYNNNPNDTDKFVYLLSLGGTASINLSMYNLNFDYKKTFDEIEELCDENLKLAFLRTNRHKAMWKRKIGETQEAKIILDNSYLQLTEMNSRIQYNFDFEIADWYRNEFDYENALKRYNVALKYAENSGDINLKMYAEIGLLLIQVALLYNDDLTDDIDNKAVNLINECDLNECTFKKHLVVLKIIRKILNNDLDYNLPNDLDELCMNHERKLIKEYGLTPNLANKLILMVH